MEAIYGANPVGARSFPMSFTSTSARAALAQGGYSLYATQDCWVKLGDVTVVAAAVSPTTTQPSGNDTFRMRAGQSYPLTVPSGKYLAVIRDSADGVLDINGPWAIPA